MGPGIVVPLVVLPVIAVAALVWYRRQIAGLRENDEAPVVSGVRLTAEALHRLPAPTWRVVHETSDRLGGVDHVVVGPWGVLAVTTVMGDRPTRSTLTDAAGGEAQLVAGAAIARGDVDDLAREAGARCDRWARVYWCTPDATRPPVEEIAPGSLLVEGQRLEEWIAGAATEPAALTQQEVDRVWRAITVGVGRPDPGA